MTPEERDRLVRLEWQQLQTREDITEIKDDVKTLLKAFNMGQGGAVAVAKIGGIVLGLAGGLAWFWTEVLGPLLGKH
jgi:hypothetical protein